jgi:hypothetical protein
LDRVQAKKTPVVLPIPARAPRSGWLVAVHPRARPAVEAFKAAVTLSAISLHPCVRSQLPKAGSEKAVNKGCNASCTSVPTLLVVPDNRHPRF